MALGKAQKQARNRQRIIQPKLEARTLTDEFRDEFIEVLDNRNDNDKFRMHVYNHDLMNGMKMNKKNWLSWLERTRKLKD